MMANLIYKNLPDEIFGTKLSSQPEEFVKTAIIMTANIKVSMTGTETANMTVIMTMTANSEIYF